jgi:hypothetical protein
MSFLLNQLSLAFWNLINSRVDAYRILKNKTIAHGINFGVYGVIVGVLVYLGRYELKTVILFCCSAFLNRQLSFDIPLNLRRGLPWYYQSIANPPKSLMDRVERKLFGVDYDGKKIVMWYSIFYAVTIIIKIM